MVEIDRKYLIALIPPNDSSILGFVGNSNRLKSNKKMNIGSNIR